MINQVVLAGRLTCNPQAGTGPAGSWLDLTLEVEHAPFEELPEVCSVRVRLLNEKQIEIAQRYLEAKKQILVRGRLQEDQDQTVVVAERWDFLPDNLENRCLWDPELSVEPMAAGMGAGF